MRPAPITQHDIHTVLTPRRIGIGLAFAAALASSSARKIYLLGRRLQALQSAASTINPSVITAIQCDVTSPDSIKSAAEQIEKDVGYIDVLINNAGVEGPRHTGIYAASSIHELQSILLSDWEGWDMAWRTNTAAVIGVSAAFLELLDKGNERRGWVKGKRTIQQRAEGAEYDKNDERTSQIITVASISAFNRQVTAGIAYTASKAGAVQIAKSMAHFLAPWGIRSNVIAPGRMLLFSFSMLCCLG